MCIYIRYSMSIIEKVFHYEENEITVIKCRDDIWFRGKDIAKALGYSIPCKAIREHVDPEDRLSLECLRNSFKKFYGRYPDLIGKYRRSVKDMVADSLPD